MSSIKGIWKPRSKSTISSMLKRNVVSYCMIYWHDVEHLNWDSTVTKNVLRTFSASNRKKKKIRTLSLSPKIRRSYKKKSVFAIKHLPNRVRLRERQAASFVLRLSIFLAKRHSWTVNSPSSVFISTSDNFGKATFSTKLPNSSSEQENREVYKSP